MVELTPKGQLIFDLLIQNKKFKAHEKLKYKNDAYRHIILLNNSTTNILQVDILVIRKCLKPKHLMETLDLPTTHL